MRLKAQKVNFCTLCVQKPCVTEVFVRKKLVFLKISVVRGSNIWVGFGGFWGIGSLKKGGEVYYLINFKRVLCPATGENLG